MLFNKQKGEVLLYCASLFYGFSQLNKGKFLNRERSLWKTKIHLLCG